MKSSKVILKNVYIFAYHHVCKKRLPSAARVTPGQFEKHILILKELNVQFFSLDELFSLPSESSQKRVAITFDDGFSCVYENAFPILEKYKLPASVFLVTHFMGQKSAWDVNFGSRRPHHLSWAQVKEMAGHKFTFGSHSHTHPDLKSNSCNTIRRELKTSKELIEDKLGEPVNLLAYPFGRFSSQTKQIAKSLDYKLGFTLIPESTIEEPFQIPRFGVYLFDLNLFFKSKLELNLLYGLEQYKLRIINFLSSGTIFVKNMNQ
ncbi:poly-beta-1,6-N-acetyl-D-glucosamine N-deacetylase precursor [bacterium BMS3Abin05]|nr:poly-beta-1,6-N-acetyl-D-glucosamine N-deacetylase precursor [bacterium BMS3Abin05]GBE27549.1 poly-beta-1,6-N-acetyl-D-glucosamine N-deacetylase precursor [bacterium BMS3Bbin03]HDL78869.1 polysaccharide deacetylase family protein [Bacteroidota bacterium]HDZ12929.1 polysaccharide deacetylase family protein [Bacteroidota bacterium]